jgi:hypothetical protein
MKSASIKCITILGLAGWACGANATLITQEKPFVFSSTSALSSGTLAVVNTGDFTSTVSAFDSSLGTLNSFSIVWDMFFEMNGTVRNATPSTGSISGGASGNVIVNGIGYNGGGGSNSIGGDPGEIISASFAVNVSDIFLSEDAGIFYDPQILAMVLGSSDFDLGYDASYIPRYNNLNGATASARGSVTLTYDYTATAVTSPITIAIFGLGLVGLGWSRHKKLS